MAVIINGSSGVTTPGISNSEGYTGDGLTIAAGAPSGAVQVDTSGNLGLWVTPSAWGAGFKAYQTRQACLSSDTANNLQLCNNAYFDGANWKYINTAAAQQYLQYQGQHQWLVAASGTAGNAISFTQAMTLDASGNLLVGTTSGGERLSVAAAQNCASFKNTGGTGKIYFLNSSASTIGSITWTGSSTSYATSSDYRLKENIQPMTGALAKVASLKPCTYKWKADGSDGEGFIAHELAEVVPQCVTGEKDAVEVVDVKDEDGNVIGTEERPVYQGIDTSFLVATLTAAIQELKAQVDAQAVEIAALKGQS